MIRHSCFHVLHLHRLTLASSSHRFIVLCHFSIHRFICFFTDLFSVSLLLICLLPLLPLRRYPIFLSSFLISPSTFLQFTTTAIAPLCVLPPLSMMQLTTPMTIATLYAVDRHDNHLLHLFLCLLLVCL